MVVLRVPNLLSDEFKRKFWESKTKLKKTHLHQWHFFQEYRIQGKKGLWKLEVNKRNKNWDIERNTYCFPPLGDFNLFFVSTFRVESSARDYRTGVFVKTVYPNSLMWKFLNSGPGPKVHTRRHHLTHIVTHGG